MLAPGIVPANVPAAKLGAEDNKPFKSTPPAPFTNEKSMFCSIASINSVLISERTNAKSANISFDTLMYAAIFLTSSEISSYLT